MITFLPKLPDNVDDLARCECDACGTVCEAWECKPIEEFHKKIKVGDEVPAGQCPNCASGLAFLIEE